MVAMKIVNLKEVVKKDIIIILNNSTVKSVNTLAEHVIIHQFV